MSFILDRIPEELRAPFVISLCAVCFYLNSVYAIRNTTKTPAKKRFLLVIAHPDDECMFFSPTLLNLAGGDNSLHVLCLSNGNADQLGARRTHELRGSCAILGISAGNVTCLDTEDLQDGMTAEWSPETVAREVKRHIETQDTFDALITFDEGGVSGHANHVAILPGLQYLIQGPGIASKPAKPVKSSNRKSKTQPLKLQGPQPEVWVLLTTSVWRKYIAVLDSMISLMLITLRVARSPGKGPEKRRNWMTFILLPHQVVRSQRAMVLGHPSQMRWFRWGWVIFGRYMVINELQRRF